MSESKGEIILYQDKEGETQIEVQLENETVWLSQAQMAELFQKSVPTINEHIKNVYEDEELEKEASSSQFQIVQIEGNREITRHVYFYNLDVIISVGYRIKSSRGTRFRIWATQTLKRYLVSSFQHQIKELLDALHSTPEACTENDNSGYVYLLQSPTGYYKIGRSKNPDNRIKTFGVKMPFEVEYLHLIETSNMAETERNLHHYFADKRAGGEWFMLNDEDIAAFKTWQVA